MKNNLIFTLVVAVIVGGLGFFGGMRYQQAKFRPMGLSGQFPQPVDGQSRPLASGGRNGVREKEGMIPVSGEIMAMDDKSIAIKTQDGSSKLVFFPIQPV